MLSAKQQQDVCMIWSGGSDQCRYAKQDKQDPSKWYCMKKIKTEKATIDSNVADFVTDCRKNGLDPAASGAALGDNCAGYPLLKYIEQGYDQP